MKKPNLTADVATVLFHFHYTDIATKFNVTEATVNKWRSTKKLPGMVVYCYEREVLQLELAKSRDPVYVFQQLISA